MEYGIVFLQGYGMSNCEGIMPLCDVAQKFKEGDYRHSAYRVALIGNYNEAEEVLNKCYEDNSLDTLYNYSIVFPTAV